MSSKTISIVPLEPVPEHVLGIREEVNMLTYGPSNILLAKEEEAIAGAVRLALRQDPKRRHGLITDLAVHKDYARQGIEMRLIQAAEEWLKAQGVTRIDAVVLDGQGQTTFFYELGYWASRKMVVMAWDLTKLSPLPQEAEAFLIEEMPRPDVDFLTDFVLASYQPYWRFWKELKDDQRWFRVEYPAAPDEPESDELAQEMRERVRQRVARFGKEAPQTLFAARAEGRVVAVCDAKAAHEGETFDWGVLVLRDFGGKRVGSALLGHALHWLKAQGLTMARIITTSGLDDYDPTVYLYSLTHGGKVLAEYLNLVKRKLTP